MTETITTEQFPIGSKWKHHNVEFPVIVTGAPFEEENNGGTRYPVSNAETNEVLPNGWVKGALEISERLDTDNVVNEPDPQDVITSLRAEVEGLRQAADHQTKTLWNVRGHFQEREEYITNLGDALRDEAIRRDWCSEYDEFAEQWDLPKRNSEWDVTITVRIQARTEDDAIEIASHGVSLDSYHNDNVINSPEFSADEVS